MLPAKFFGKKEFYAALAGTLFGAFLTVYADTLNLLYVMYVFILAVSLAMMQNSTGVFRLNRLTVPTVWYWTYLPMIFLPSLWVYETTADPYRFPYVLGVASVLLTVPVGIAAANRMFRFDKKEIDSYFLKDIEESPARQGTAVFSIAVFLMGIAVFLFVSHLARIKVIPLFYLMSHPAHSLEDVAYLQYLREASFKLFDPRWNSGEGTFLFYGYLFLRNVLFPFLVLFTLGYAVLTKKLKWWISFWLMLVMTAFYVSVTLMRMPLAALFMRLFFFIYLMRKGRIGRLTSTIFLLLILSFPLFVTGRAYGVSLTFAETLQRIAIRLTGTPAMDLFYYFKIFPLQHDFVYGGTLIKPVLHFLGESYFYIENYVSLVTFPESPVTSHMNAAFISNLYADFGLPGVLAGGVFAGFMMQWIQIYLCRTPKSVMNITLYCYMIFAIWNLNFGSITSVLLANGVLPVGVLIWMFYLMKNVLDKASAPEPQP